MDVALVTGANTGIGRVTARELARRGMHVVVACRSEEKGREAVAAIRRETGSDSVELLQLDLTSLASVRAAARAFRAKGIPLRLLVNNAGVGGQRGVTTDGFELHFGTNHLGHFLLTTLLLDTLIASAPARVVTVSSKAHVDATGIDWSRVEGSTRTITGLPEYAVSKLANILFTKELARRLAGTNVTTYAVHPGVVASDVWRRIPWPIRPLVTRNMLSNEDGAKTTLHCATAPEAAGETGLYYDEERPRDPSALASDAHLAHALWERSEAFVRRP
jgi:NAD(P)-dependent dehydrogenase (short-subunit alcohol dehydrogenase family)